MNEFDICIQNTDLETFNQKHNIVIDRNMSLYSVHSQLERVSNIECGYISKTKKEH